MTVLCVMFFVVMVPVRVASKQTTYTQTTSDAVEEQVKGGNESVKNTATKNLETDFSNESDIIQDQQDDEEVWIKDDVKCSGLYRVEMSDKLTSTLADLSETNKQKIKYTWYRITQDDGAAVPEPDTTPGTAVTYKQIGDDYNIAPSARYATWLRLDADENGEIWRNDKDRYYYVTVSYPEETIGAIRTVTSAPMKVNWYSQLENGDFEVPSILNNGASSDTGSKFRNDYSNAVYKAKKGVWQTTGKGTGENTGADIEIVNTSEYGWRSMTPPENYGFDDSAKFKAAWGDQFVKLNCKNAGALYQDVITHSNETLNYQFSHHARGQYTGKKGRTKHRREYDTMYLVIMPTQLAMTSSSNGTELTSQGDLIDFINAHGGFSYTKASGIEDQVTHEDNTSGILIHKVSSSNEAWHDISKISGYTAKGGLTRFFFVSGPTAWPEAGSRNAVLNATNGNLLDNVGFSQVLSTPKGFDLTVKKTFSGMTPSAVEKMKTGENAYKLTVTKGDESKTLILAGDQESGVPLAETQSGSQKIFTWTIEDWGYDGNYSVKEENIVSPVTHQKPSQIKINGDALTGHDFTDATHSNIICGEDFTGHSEITVENSYDPNIKIKKTDGVAFKLYRLNSNNSKEYFISKDDNGIIIWDEVPNGKYFKAEGTDDMVDIGVLPRATSSDGDAYYLEAVKASGDNSTLTQDIGFKVLSDGRVSGISDSSLMTVDDRYPYFLITVKNSAEAFPNTGGAGIALFIIIGAIIAICATAAIAKRRNDLQKKA